MKNLPYTFLAAVISFTRFPIKCSSLTSLHFKQAHYFLPLIGVCIGLAVAAIYWLTGFIVKPDTAILIALISGILLTGAIHEDGFADCCDGFGGGNTAETILTIMKDSRLGTYGVLGLISLLSIKYALFCNLLPASLMVAFITIAAMARLCPLWVMYFTPALNTTNAKMSAELHHDIYPLLLTTTISFVCLFALQSLQVVALLAFTLLVCSSLCSLYFRKKLGGYNGDCLGASEQIAEIMLLLALLIYQSLLF